MLETGLRRKAAAAFLTNQGYQTAENTLATLASRGGGPKYRKYGKYPIYLPTDLIAWAEARAGSKISSTSEAA